MDKEIAETIKAIIKDWELNMVEQLKLLGEAMNKRFENLKKVVGDYLELSSSLSISSVKANLKNV